MITMDDGFVNTLYDTLMPRKKQLDLGVSIDLEVGHARHLAFALHSSLQPYTTRIYCTSTFPDNDSKFFHT